MATWPEVGSANWSAPLKEYIDSRVELLPAGSPAPPDPEDGVLYIRATE